MFPLPRSSTIWGYDTPVELLRLQLESKCASTVVVKPEGRRSAAAAVALIVVTKEDFLCQTFYYCTILESCCFHGGGGGTHESTHGEPAYYSAASKESTTSLREQLSLSVKVHFGGLSFVALERPFSPPFTVRKPPYYSRYVSSEARGTATYMEFKVLPSRCFCNRNAYLGIFLRIKGHFQSCWILKKSLLGGRMGLLVFLMSVMRQFFPHNLLQ